MKKFNKGRLLYSDRFVKDSNGFYYETGENLAFRFGKPLFIGRGKGRKMKTSKEMQLKIIDKMRENVESGMHHYFGIETEFGGEWRDMENDEAFYFLDFGYRIKGYFITINGVEIPKPLGSDEILEDEVYYHVDNSEFLYEARHGEFIADHGIRFVYETKEEAITASKALFGIKGE